MLLSPARPLCCVLPYAFWLYWVNSRAWIMAVDTSSVALMSPLLPEAQTHIRGGRQDIILFLFMTETAGDGRWSFTSWPGHEQGGAVVLEYCP